MQAGAAGMLAARVGEELGPPGAGTGETGAWRWPCRRGQAPRKRESSWLCGDPHGCPVTRHPVRKAAEAFPRSLRADAGVKGHLVWGQGSTGCVGDTEVLSSEGKWKTRC